MVSTLIAPHGQTFSSDSRNITGSSMSFFALHAKVHTPVGIFSGFIAESEIIETLEEQRDSLVTAISEDAIGFVKLVDGHELHVIPPVQASNSAFTFTIKELDND